MPPATPGAARPRHSGTIGLCRGYTGHEMMGEYGLDNMNRRSLAHSGESNGRLYDPTLNRFLSPDNYVQEPDNSQSFNRYSYCLNNPLKYTDPSGELSGIDDLTLAIVGLGVVNSMIHAAYSGTNIWKAEAQSLFLAAANYATCDLWQAFGEVNGVGHELLRAGAHGLFNATLSALESGDFLKGALNGFQIGLLNHAMHGGNNKKMMGKPGICVLLPDRTYAVPYDLDEFGPKCTSCAKKNRRKVWRFPQK